LKAILMEYVGRFEEARALHDGAVAIGERHAVPRRHVALQNAAVLRITQDMPGALESCEAAMAAARQRGDRAGESIAICNLMSAQLLAGHWREMQQIGTAALEDDPERPEVESIHQQLGLLSLHRGEIDLAGSHLERMSAFRDSDDVEARLCWVSLAGLIALAEGELGKALELLTSTVNDGIAVQGPSSEATRLVWPEAVLTALDLGRIEEAVELIALLTDRPPGLVPPLLQAELSRAQALLDARGGNHDAVEAQFESAIEGLVGLDYPFWLARARGDLGGWLIEQGREPDAVEPLAAAAAALRTLEARPALARVQELARRRAAPADAVSAPT
jgi:hypothetical protein